MAVHQLAENLSTPVYELKAKMPASEFRDWIAFYAEKARQQDQSFRASNTSGKVSTGNLINSPQGVLAGLGL
jgi:hypothetical protein